MAYHDLTFLATKRTIPVMSFSRRKSSVSDHLLAHCKRLYIHRIWHMRKNSLSSASTHKLKLIRILAEDLDTLEDSTPSKTYDLPTPYVR